MAIAAELLILLGGVLLVIGSFAPWTKGAVVNSGVVLYRSGWQLGNNQSFSAAGLLVALVGTHATLISAIRLAKKDLLGSVAWPPLIDGLAGISVAMFGMHNSSTYVHLMLQNSGLFVAGTGYGIWLVVIGSAFILVASFYARRRVAAAGIAASLAVMLAIGIATALVAPV